MVRLRLVLIGVFCWIALMLAAGRSDQLPIIGNVNPAFYVYLIAAMTVGVLIVYPEHAQKPTQVTFVPVLGIYAVCKAIQSAGQTIDASFMYLVITEVVILYITLYIGRMSAMMLANVERSIHNSLLQLDTLTVLNERDGEKIITEEILRARQYERSVTLIHIQIPRLHKRRFTRWSREKRLEYEYVYLRVMQIIRNLIYDSDIIAWHKNNLVVCLPETSKDEAGVLVFPLGALLAACLRENTKITMAHFPDDALVYKDLLRVALTAAPIEQEPVLAAEPAKVVEEYVEPEHYDRPALVMEDLTPVRSIKQQSA